jgi:hypothetical protein
MASSRINIFSEHKATRSPTDFVGRFRSGMQTSAGRPMSIQEWRVTTGDPAVADRIADLYGGTPQSWQTKTDENLEVLTTESTVKVILDGPDAIRSGLVLWGRGNQPIRKCDGVTQSDGQACVCPSDLNARKEAAKAGSGCDVSITISFALADDPDLGQWKFQSSSWTLAKEVGAAQDALDKIGGPALAELSLVHVSYETRAGQRREFTKPVISVIGPAPDA